MRETKFRGMTSSGQWVYGWLYHDQRFIDGHSCVDVYIIREDGDEDHLVTEKSIGQFTGLKDRFDTPIYEGDIVSKWQCANGEIEFVDGSFCNKVKTPKGFRSYHLSQDESDMFEVKGNIYEDSRLLEAS